MTDGRQRPAFAVFPTALGECAIVWRDDGGGAVVIGSTLPQGGPDHLRAAVRRWYPDAVESGTTTSAARAVEAVTRLLEDGDDAAGPGERTRAADIPLDMTGVPAFDRRVYEVVRAIPPGETLTYGEVAARVGAPGAAQAVGQAMGRNPFPPIVPCHRVLAAGRKIGGFSARGGALTKLRMLEREGVYLEQPTLFDL